VNVNISIHSEEFCALEWGNTGCRSWQHPWLIDLRKSASFCAFSRQNRHQTLQSVRHEVTILKHRQPWGLFVLNTTKISIDRIDSSRSTRLYMASVSINKTQSPASRSTSSFVWKTRKMSRCRKMLSRLLHISWKKVPKYSAILCLEEHILQKIYQHLSLVDQVCLSLSCKELFGLFGTIAKHKDLEFHASCVLGTQYCVWTVRMCREINFFFDLRIAAWPTVHSVWNSIHGKNLQDIHWDD
jgi:hypothetical protein